jgi:hypothetical protein
LPFISNKLPVRPRHMVFINGADQIGVHSVPKS